MAEVIEIIDPLPSSSLDGQLSRAAAPPIEWVAPVPEDAPEPPPQSGSQRWWYHDASGRRLHAVDRWEKQLEGGRKRFVPRTLWKAKDGTLSWRAKHPSTRRPVYGLYNLAQRPAASVLIVEGEKTADAAIKLFPEFVVVTSSGGTNAASKSDWSPLAGRNVIIWPDNDEPGQKYARDVAELLWKAGAASVHLVVIPAQWPDAWDLADTRPESVTVQRLREMLAEAVEHFSQEGSAGFQGSASDNLRKVREQSHTEFWDRVGFHEGSKSSAKAPAWLPRDFRRGDDGSIYYEDQFGERQWLCSQIEIVAATRNIEGEAWGRLVRVRDRDGKWHDWAMPMAELAGSGESYRAHLLSMGLELAPGTAARNALHRLLTNANPQARVRCVPTPGWHQHAFVRPDEVIGETNDEQLTLQTSGRLPHNFKVAGALEGWQEGIAKPAIGNSRLVFGISMAFAAPLLRPLGMEGGGVHFHGSSSTGKTTLGEVAGSACGGGQDGYKVPWRTTDNAIEAVAAAHNDGFIVLDEIGQVSADALAHVAYMLANGQAKQRMTREAALRPSSSWRVLFLSTGEIGLADKLREGKRGGGRLMAGQEVRVLDLPADAGAGHGVFDMLNGFSSGQAFADHLKHVVSQHYGHAQRDFLRRLIADPKAIERAREFIDGFVAKVTPAGADGQVRRAAHRFAAITAGGELACEYGILPWPEGEAMNAAARLFREWLAGRGGIEPAEVEHGITAVRHFLEVHGTSRFAPWDDPCRQVQNRAGFVRQGEGGTVYYVLPEAWRQDVLAGRDARMIAREMARRGMLKVNADGKPQTAQQLPDGGAKRKVYVVLPTIFEDVTS